MKSCEEDIEENVKKLADYYYEQYKTIKEKYEATRMDFTVARMVRREEMLTWKDAIERMVFLKLINSEDYKL